MGGLSNKKANRGVDVWFSYRFLGHADQLLIYIIIPEIVAWFF